MYKLFQYTDNAEYILKAMHMLIHSSILAAVVLVSFNYFKRD